MLDILRGLTLNKRCFFLRYQNEKQKALVLAYAELEDEVSGTVNGVDKSAKGG